MPAESIVGTISFTRSGSPIGARVSSPKNVLGPIRRAIQKFQHRTEVSVAHLLSNAASRIRCSNGSTLDGPQVA